MPEVGEVRKPEPVFGVHIEVGTYHRSDWLADGAPVRILVRWSEIERQPGVYFWNNQLEMDLRNLYEKGNPLLLTVITTPAWARTDLSLRCSPPKPEYLDDLAEFINLLATRYSFQAVELANEPEISPSQIGHLDNWMGCWGPDGEAYAGMLKVVYPRVKAENPDLTVVAGSLMLDGEQIEFWKSALASGAAEYYDVLSYHAYAYYPRDDWDTLFEKAAALREIGEEAPLWVTETSLLCLDEYIHCGDNFRKRQGDYLRYLITQQPGSEIERIYWYSLANNAWRHSDLIEMNIRKPVWYVFDAFVSAPFSFWR